MIIRCTASPRGIYIYILQYVLLDDTFTPYYLGSLTGDKMDEAVINQVTQDQLFNWLATANASVCPDT